MTLPFQRNKLIVLSLFLDDHFLPRLKPCFANQSPDSLSAGTSLPLALVALTVSNRTLIYQRPFSMLVVVAHRSGF